MFKIAPPLNSVLPEFAYPFSNVDFEGGVKKIFIQTAKSSQIILEEFEDMFDNDNLEKIKVLFSRVSSIKNEWLMIGEYNDAFFCYVATCEDSGFIFSGKMELYISNRLNDITRF